MGEEYLLLDLRVRYLLERFELIEALLVVFKISLHDYKDLPYAALLIASISGLMFVFAFFIYLNQKHTERCKEEI